MNRTSYVAPSVETHVPIKVVLPTEATDLAVDGRADIPPPSLWQQSVQVTHKVTSKVAIVARVDWSTNMFRAYYPDEGEEGPDGKPQGRYSHRTEWEHCRDWEPAVTFSPKELERQAARELLEEEIKKLDAKSLAAVSVLCDDPDPAKALAKLEALRQMGVIKVSGEAAQEVVPKVRKP